MRSVTCILLFVVLAASLPATAQAQAGLARKPAQELIEALGRYLGRGEGRDLSRELAEMGGEAFARRVADKALNQGGDDALEQLVRLTQIYGPDALRAADNSPSLPAIIQALDELPVEMAAPALRRLAAGTHGRALAEATERFGAAALRAEVRHPGVGGDLVRVLGDDGARLADRLSTPQAIEVGRHADDLARLPEQQRQGLLALLYDDTERMVRWMGRFAENNPRTVLFTPPIAAFVLANSERLLGDGGKIVFDDDGEPVRVEVPGLGERVLALLIERLLSPLMTQIASWVLPLLAAALAVWIAIRLWYARRLARLRFEAARRKLETAPNPNDLGDSPEDTEPPLTSQSDHENRRQ